MPEITDRIAEVLREHQPYGLEPLWADKLAAVLVETLGLTPEYAVCFDDDGQTWLIGETRYTRPEFAAVDVPEHPEMIKPFVGRAYTTMWEKADG